MLGSAKKRISDNINPGFIMYKEIVDFIKNLYQTEDFIPLHAPVFRGNEKKYVNECIDSTFVSSVGKFVDKFEELCRDYTQAKYAVATMNGTSALHIALLLSGVKRGDEVITQALTFVATANAIAYTGAQPVFVDVDLETMGLSPRALEDFLKANAEVKDGYCVNKNTGRRIKAVVPMHTFGHPVRLKEIKQICENYHLSLIEDSAESLGSFFRHKHTGTFGDFGILSFNGNKTITCGGGGMILTDNEENALRAKRLTTTAKVPHRWEFVHDEIAYNYRLTNLSAALGCAQMEQLDNILSEKREIASQYKDFFENSDIVFFNEPENSRSNYWLNAIIFNDLAERNAFLEYSNDNGVMTRPIWRLMNELPMYQDCQTDTLKNSKWLQDRVVNLPSGVRWQ